MPMLGWKDRKTGRMYDSDSFVCDIDTGKLVAIMQCQITGIKVAVRNKFELIDVDGEIVPRFCRWGINSGHVDDSF